MLGRTWLRQRVFLPGNPHAHQAIEFELLKILGWLDLLPTKFFFADRESARGFLLAAALPMTAPNQEIYAALTSFRTLAVVAGLLSPDIYLHSDDLFEFVFTLINYAQLAVLCWPLRPHPPNSFNVRFCFFCCQLTLCRCMQKAWPSMVSDHLRSGRRQIRYTNMQTLVHDSCEQSFNQQVISSLRTGTLIYRPTLKGEYHFGVVVNPRDFGRPIDILIGGVNVVYNLPFVVQYLDEGVLRHREHFDSWFDRKWYQLRRWFSFKSRINIDPSVEHFLSQPQGPGPFLVQRFFGNADHVLQRAIDSIGYGHYNGIWQNCQHAACFIATGRTMSSGIARCADVMTEAAIKFCSIVTILQSFRGEDEPADSTVDFSGYVISMMLVLIAVMLQVSGRCGRSALHHGQIFGWSALFVFASPTLALWLFRSRALTVAHDRSVAELASRSAHHQFQPATASQAVPTGSTRWSHPCCVRLVHCRRSRRLAQTAVTLCSSVFVRRRTRTPTSAPWISL